MKGLQEHDIPLRICKSLNWLLMVSIFTVTWVKYYRPYVYKNSIYTDIAIIIIFALLYFIFGRIYEAFQVSMHRVSEMVYSQFLSLVFSNGIAWLIIWLMSSKFPNPLYLLAGLAVETGISVVWCILSNHWYYEKFPPAKTAVIYDAREGMDELVREYNMDRKFEVILITTAEECIRDLPQLKLCTNVFLSGVHSHDRNVILKYCVEQDIRVYVIPRVGDVIMSGAEKVHMFHLPMLRVGRYHPNPEYLFGKRLFDVCTSFLALILLSPVMLATAVSIKCYDHGPVFYRQKRLTQNGREFYVLKFRSMRTDAEKDGVARLSSGEQDDRITPVGRIIRACRIDELPQLINILKGDMSVVGPRPERPEIAALYCEEMPEFNLRLQAKAGLTGYAQVYGKYNTTPYDKLQMDLMYIANPGIREDLKICFATVKILFLPESTEGVEKGQITASRK